MTPSAVRPAGSASKSRLECQPRQLWPLQTSRFVDAGKWQRNCNKPKHRTGKVVEQLALSLVGAEKLGSGRHRPLHCIGSLGHVILSPICLLFLFYQSQESSPTPPNSGIIGSPQSLPPVLLRSPWEIFCMAPRVYADFDHPSQGATLRARTTRLCDRLISEWD